MAYCRPFQINTNVVSAEKNYWFFQKYLKHKDVCSKPVVSQSIYECCFWRRPSWQTEPPLPLPGGSAVRGRADKLCPCSFILCYCYLGKLTHYVHAVLLFVIVIVAGENWHVMPIIWDFVRWDLFWAAITLIAVSFTNSSEIKLEAGWWNLVRFPN